MTLSALERRVIDSLPEIDAGKVGAVIGMGAQCIVRSYDSGPKRQVLKLPLPLVRRGVYARTMGKMLCQHHDGAKAELDACSHYFEAFMVPTRIVRGPRPELFCILQDRIDLTEVTPEVLSKSPYLHGQLSQIVEANRRMMAERGQWLDVMGWKLPKFIRFVIQGKPYLENVALDPLTQRLQLFDFGLFPLPHRSPLSMRVYYQFLLRLQRQNMARFGYPRAYLS